MISENQQRVLEIKKKFGWPVDGFRYNYNFLARFWDGTNYRTEPGELVAKRMKISLEKLRTAAVVPKLLSKLPWVLGILVTGSVASLNAKAEDDIDFWLLVEPRRIWLTRAFDWLIFTIRGKRRLAKHGIDAHKVADRFCFNFYSVAGKYQLQKQTISYAMQLVDAIPLWLRSESVYQELLEQNKWVCEFFPEWYKKNRVETEKTQKTESTEETDICMFTRLLQFPLFPPFLLVLDLLEYVAGVLMLLKSRKKLYLSPSSVFLNEFTTWQTERILSDYEQKTITEGSQEI